MFALLLASGGVGTYERMTPVAFCVLVLQYTRAKTTRVYARALHMRVVHMPAQIYRTLVLANNRVIPKGSTWANSKVRDVRCGARSATIHYNSSDATNTRKFDADG